MTGKSTVSGIEQAVEALRKAMIAGDRAALSELTTDELTYGHGGGHVEDKAQFIDKLASGKSGWSEIELTELSVQVIDGIAIVRHVFRGASRHPPDGIVNKKLSVLGVWVQRGGQWKLLARQAVQLSQ